MIFKHTEVDLSKTDSKLLHEYIPFKKSNTDSIVFFQVGDFFETYFEDAHEFSSVTGAVISYKTINNIGKVPQAGVPIKSLDSHIKKMLDENYKVCVCKQYFDEEKNEYYRKINRKYTKGTIVEKEFLNSHENNFLVAISKIDNKNFSFAYADVSTGQFYKTIATCNQLFFEIDKIEPNELLVLNRDYADFKNLANKYNSTVLDESFVDLSADEIILKYCLVNQKEYCVKLNSVIHYEISNFLTMDEVTRINLEITRTRRFLKKKGSIFWFLNYARTPMGIRLLKKYLNEPLLNVEEIIKRQNAVLELLKNNDTLLELEDILDGFCDLSRVCSQISNSTILPKDLLQVSNSSKIFIKMSSLCKKFNSKLLTLNQEKIDKVLKFSYEIAQAIDKDANNELKSGGIINNGYYPNLDYLRDRLKETEKSIEVYRNKEQNRLGVKNLKISFNKTLGYFIELPASKALKVTAEYIKKQTLSNCTRYTTSVLKQYEQEFFNFTYQINELEYELYCQLRKKALQFVDTIRALALEVALIDVLFSFAKCAKLNQLVKPEFNESNLKIIDGFHPSLLKLNNELVKNDTNLDDGNMMVLMGANMSGKSTYIKHNAIIVLLSQIGSFIPATNAQVSITDKIFLHQGSTDDIINNNSSFMVEMNDLRFILDNITNRSLVLLDEPAKSTNAKEGGAIARAFCEYLLQHYKAKYIIATHNSELAKLEQDYPTRVSNYIMQYDKNGTINRKITKGICNTSNALSTAKLACLPHEIIEKAQKYLLD